MINIQLYNKISEHGLNIFPTEYYTLHDKCNEPDAILLRSQSLQEIEINQKLKVIARAGAGVNNIPIEQLTPQGIVVFNTPGANANAVKEVVIASLLISSRQLCQSWQHTLSLTGNDIANQVETLKKKYTGFELPGKTLGIVGLGAIGVKVANTATDMGLKVIGFDPHMTIKNAWQLSSLVSQASSLAELMQQSDFLTIHVPYMKKTHHLINQQNIDDLKSNAILLNFSRGEIICQDTILKALNDKKLAYYVTDFPNQELIKSPQVICFPHLGASTYESEQNCATMAANTLRKFFEFGTIENSVNFPDVHLSFKKGFRLAIINQNIPNMLGQILKVIAQNNLNIIDMINKSRDDIAYTLIDCEQDFSDKLIQSVKLISGIIECRKINVINLNT